ncbi:MAG: ATPase, T2SS/T4P/T4SS family, partial [Planctomycetota bacterium]|nr:ATPase, T2SS/T4P/T4SS family [Planctomycetota bacterium]
RLDPDARSLRLDATKWNLIHLITAIVSLGVMLFAGIFYISWLVGVAVMLIPILIYWKVRNTQVPEDRRFRLFAGKSADGDEVKKKRPKRRKGQDATLVFDCATGEFPIPEKGSDLLDTYLLMETLLKPAIEKHASRIDIALGSGGLASAIVVNTVRTKQDPLDASEGVKVVNLLKTIAGLDLAETRKHQTSEFDLIAPGSRHTITVTVTGSTKGQIVRLDIDQANSLMIPIDAIGLLPDQRMILSEFIAPHNRHGIVLISSPQGQGLTTTGFSLITQHDAYTSNLKVLEHRTIKRLEGVDHVEWDPSNPDLDFSTSLQSILRRDPDVVLAEVPNPETAQVAARAGRDGALQYLTFNADSAAVAIREWCRLVGDVDQ